MRFDDSAVCKSCDGTGLERLTCQPGHRCMVCHTKPPRDPLYEHYYGVPCRCSDGDKWSRVLAAMNQRGSSLASAGRTGRRASARGFTKIGKRVGIVKPFTPTEEGDE